MGILPFLHIISLFSKARPLYFRQHGGGAVWELRDLGFKTSIRKFFEQRKEE